MMEVGRVAAILLQTDEYQFIKYKSFCTIEMLLICILYKINLNTCFLLEQSPTSSSANGHMKTFLF